MSTRPRFRAYHSESPNRSYRVSCRLLVADVIVSMKPVIVTCVMGAAGGACAHAPGATIPRTAMARDRARTLLIHCLLMQKVDGPRYWQSCQTAICTRNHGYGNVGVAS